MRRGLVSMCVCVCVCGGGGCGTSALHMPCAEMTFFDPRPLTAAPWPLPLAPPQAAADAPPPVALRSAFLSGNQLTGNLPPEWGSLAADLEALDLSANSLGGALPADWDLPNLMLLDLSNNSFGGEGRRRARMWGVEWAGAAEHARGLGGSQQVGTPHRLLHARLRPPPRTTPPMPGSLPTALASLPSLIYMSTSGNTLNGDLTPFADALASNGSSTVVHLDLSSNRFEGTIPASFGDSPIFNVTDPVMLNGCAPMPHLRWYDQPPRRGRWRPGRCAACKSNRGSGLPHTQPPIAIAGAPPAGCSTCPTIASAAPPSPCGCWMRSPPPLTPASARSTSPVG